jgi:polar amino acid transport system substrate-binding protein
VFLLETVNSGVKLMKYSLGRRRFLVYGGLGLTSSLLLKACGSSAPPADTAATTESPDQVSAGVTLDKIREMGRLRVGLDGTYPPFASREGNKLVGYDIDLGNIMAKNLGVEFEPMDTDWSGVIPSLFSGNFDLIFGSMSYTPERVERVSFSIPYTEASQAALIRAEDADTITSISDLSGKKLGIKLGSPGETLSEKLDAQLKEEAGSGFSEIRIYDDHPAAYIALAQERVDAVLNTLATLSIVLRDQPDTYTILRDVGSQNWAGIAARPEDTDLIEFVDDQLRTLQADGTLAELQEKWFGFTMKLIDKKPAVQDGELVFI